MEAILPYQDSQSPLPLLNMMALLMSQLQPMLDGFNHTLEHLTQEVEGLSRDVALLRNSQWEVEEEALRGAGAGEGPEALEAKLEQSFQDTKEVRRELERQRAEMADRLHSQHAMLHYNITNFKTDIDGKIKRNHKMLQVSESLINVSHGMVTQLFHNSKLLDLVPHFCVSNRLLDLHIMGIK